MDLVTCRVRTGTGRLTETNMKLIKLLRINSARGSGALRNLRHISWILAACVLLGNIVTVNALSPDQLKIYNERIFMYDVTYDASCLANASASSGSAPGSATITTDLQSFVNMYGQAAFDIGKKNGIPYDAILAQASLESNWGQSTLNKQAFNFFGMKAGSSWTGPTVTMRTAEQTPSGGVYYVDAQFRAYPDAASGFQGYVDFLKSFPRYANVFNFQHDPVGYFQALKNDGYATDVSYVSKLTSRLTSIQQYIASKSMFPPSSQVQYDVQPSGGTSTASAGSTPGSADSSCGPSGSGSATGVAAIAIQEVGNHYAKYTNGRTENWCADFVSWVYKAAGKPFTPTPGVPMVDGWQIPSVDGMLAYLKAKGQFFPKSPTAPAPQPGDIVIYKNGMSHTNIVVEANGYMVKTVGGNQESNDFTQSMVSESKGAFDIRNDATVTGWGRLP